MPRKPSVKPAKQRAKKPAAARRPGRPTKYRAEYAEQAGHLCRLGATNAELAAFFGVVEATINTWKTAHPEFQAALDEAKAIADGRVVQSLYRRAIGYEHPAVKILTVADGNNQGSHIEEVPYVERYPPDPTSMIFWLKNRQPGAWRDKQHHEHEAGGSLTELMRQAFGGGATT